MKFNVAAAVRLITDERGTVSPYLKVRMDKVIGLVLPTHQSIRAYKLVQFGAKEVLQVIFTDDGKSSLENFD